MKIITTPAVITTMSSRQDGSIRFSAETPEYADEEFTEFRRLQGKNIQMTLTPTDEIPTDELKIDRDMEDKPRHVRLRNVLFVYWQQKMKDTYPEFDVFYKSKMDKLIEDVKEKLEN